MKQEELRFFETSAGNASEALTTFERSFKAGNYGDAVRAIVQASKFDLEGMTSLRQVGILGYAFCQAKYMPGGNPTTNTTRLDRDQFLAMVDALIQEDAFSPAAGAIDAIMETSQVDDVKAAVELADTIWNVVYADGRPKTNRAIQVWSQKVTDAREQLQSLTGEPAQEQANSGGAC
jgi:hypothetical protein